MEVSGDLKQEPTFNFISLKDCFIVGQLILIVKKSENLTLIIPFGKNQSKLNKKEKKRIRKREIFIFDLQEREKRKEKRITNNLIFEVIKTKWLGNHQNKDV